MPQHKVRRNGLTRPSVALMASGVSLAILAQLLAPAPTASGAQRSAALGALVEVGALARPPAGARPTGALRAGARVSLGVALNARNTAGLANYAAAVSTPSSPDYHHFLSPAQFATRYGPSSGALSALRLDLRTAGLSVSAPSANGLLVNVHGTAGQVDRAFHTALEGYRLPGGSFGWSPSAPTKLPAVIARGVAAIVGLDNTATPRSMLERAPVSRKLHVSAAAFRAARRAAARAPLGSPRACVAATDAALQSGGWTDQQLASAYGLKGLYRAGDLAQGQSIGVFELEPFSNADLATFDRCYFGASHVSQIRRVNVDGFNLTGTGSGEALLDLEDLQALAPDAKIVVYQAPNTTFGAIDAYNAIVSQDRVNIVSTSWGECEQAVQTAAPQTLQLENILFEEAAAQGQTVFAAAGDTGSDDCASTPFGSSTPAAPYLSVDDPASQPYVVGVGGTSMINDANPPRQTVWNDGAKWGGGGGGLSTTWSSPAWQQGSGVPGTAVSTRREVPDVSAAADEWRGITVFSALFGSGGSIRAPAAGRATAPWPTPPAGWATLGGTSSAAPIWAAVDAEITASRLCAAAPVNAAGRDLGFLAPLLYEVAGSPTAYAHAFDNVRVGNNDVFGLGLGYSAHAGFNLASGLGSPIVTNAAGRSGLDAALCALATGSAPAPVLTSVSPSVGPTSGGTAVTISGTGFPAGDPAAVSVHFGSVPATVTAVPSSTTIDVTAPAALLAPKVASDGGSGSAGPVNVSVTVTSATARQTARVGLGARFDYVVQASNGSVIPTVAAINPSGGNLLGGNRVLIYGTGFTASSTPSVTFGGVSSPSVSVLSTTELSVVVPPERSSTACATGPGYTPSVACQVQVVVSDANGSSPTATILPPISGPIVFQADGVVAPTPETEVGPAASEYDYAPKPVITSVAPDPGDASGQTPVEINGRGFSFNTLEWVNFGPPGQVASEQTQILAITPTRIIITPPSGSASGSTASRLPGGVSVQTVAGRSAQVPYSFAGVPEISAMSTLGGPATGGSRIVIRGHGMGLVDYVEFASQVSPTAFGASVSVRISSRTARAVTVRTPADLPGPVDVLVCSATGCSGRNPSVDTFVYYSVGRPSLATMSRASGPAQGGTAVDLFGNGLNGTTAVRFGRSVTTRIEPVAGYPDGDPYVVRVLTPPGPASASVPVLAVTRAGTSVGGARLRFHYLPSAPSAPASLHVTLSASSASLRWGAPASDGGSPVTGYFILASGAGMAPLGAHLAASARSYDFSSLPSGRALTFRVAAENAAHGRGPWAANGPLLSTYGAAGYRLVSSSGLVEGLGSLPSLGGIGGGRATSPVVSMVGTSTGEGYWLVQRDGTVSTFGDAPAFAFAHPAQATVGLAPIPGDLGYWVATANGKVFAYGNARQLASLSPIRLRRGESVVAIVASPSGQGYWLVTSLGRIFAFGDATHWPAANTHGARVVAAQGSGSVNGLWLLTSTGSVIARGKLAAYGGIPPASLGHSLPVGLAPTADGKGYWIATAAGRVFSFGNARYEGGVQMSGGVAGIATV